MRTPTTTTHVYLFLLFCYCFNDNGIIVIIIRFTFHIVNFLSIHFFISFYLIFSLPFPFLIMFDRFESLFMLFCWSCANEWNTFEMKVLFLIVCRLCRCYWSTPQIRSEIPWNKMKNILYIHTYTQPRYIS